MNRQLRTGIDHGIRRGAFEVRVTCLSGSGTSLFRQRGVALVVALILLVVITLVGLAAVSGTIMQNKMAGNQYDRELAFQSAAAALRVGEQSIGDAPAGTVRQCGNVAQVCLPNPFDDSNITVEQLAKYTQTVPTADYQPSTAATGQPEYIIEYLGPGYAESGTGTSQSVNCKQYGAANTCPNTKSVYYRITARSGDPAKIGDRALVTLQAVVRINVAG